MDNKSKITSPIKRIAGSDDWEMLELENNLMNEIQRILQEEISSGRFSTLYIEDWRIIFRIVMSEIFSKIEYENFITSGEETDRKSAELIFVAAPTGAGKDTLVMKIEHDNKDRKYVVLNMDKFRHYYPFFLERIKVDYPDGMKDKDFAAQTSGFAYEIYYTMQRLLLENFPGTNIIITGTIRDYEWVEETFKRFKSNPFTKYVTKLYALAVPKTTCAFSALKRYLLSINKYEPGTARYTPENYCRETINNFPINLAYFEKIYNSPDGYIDVIEVYRRNTRQEDLDEETILYTTYVEGREKTDTRGAVYGTVNNILNRDEPISSFALLVIMERIQIWSEYLKDQNLYQDILKFLEMFRGKHKDELKRQEMKTLSSKKKEDIGSGEGRYPGCDD